MTVFSASSIDRSRRADVSVSAGSTYVIDIWSFLSPGAEFVLQSALQ